MSRVFVFHWQADRASERSAELEAFDYVDVVDVESKDGGRALSLRDDPPDAVVIDLSRAPSRGRDVALFLRGAKATRRVPLVFVGGRADKVAAIAKLLPDAVFTSWEAIEPELAEAIAHPPDDPVVPSSNLAGYSGTPLPKKLGIKPGYRVALANAPAALFDLLERRPSGVELDPDDPDSCDLRLWFVRWRDDLGAGIARMASRVPDGGLWIAWPKKASRLDKDITANDVRGLALEHGLVDYKVCAIDKDWSGLKFAVRTN